jgi:fumarylacetoacetase
MASSKTWLEIPSDSHFTFENIPFGIISTPDNKNPRVAVALGSYAFDLEHFANCYGFDDLEAVHGHISVFRQPALNKYAALGRGVHKQVRAFIQDLFASDSKNTVLRDDLKLQEQALHPLDQVTMHLPFQIGDYTDFYVGLHHAMNCGLLMRGPGQELQPNYKHLPVGYHGRASSVVVSGTPIVRPSGQILPAPGARTPIFSACRRLDFELELGCFVCTPNKMGEPVKVAEAEENLFGVVLMNDWSARDIQTWEMVPLGPFNAKNFGTSVSPWVVTMDALQPFLVPGLESDQELLPYLRGEQESKVVDISLEVELESESDTATAPEAHD